MLQCGQKEKIFKKYGMSGGWEIRQDPDVFGEDLFIAPNWMCI